MKYEPVIGLEVHAQLATKTKLFCGCLTEFGAPPNSHCCPVCTGMPGVLPVLNRRAFELCVKTALALNCKIARRTWFDRKNYYYPDLPKNYQISQNSSLLGADGFVEIEFDGQTKNIRINNVHLEEDAGKLIHGEEPGADYSVVDLNRTGTPLAEIVTEPDMNSVEEAVAYMETLRRILEYTQVSDCKMAEGSIRFEASISLRLEGEKQLGNRVEIKNLNSLKAVQKTLLYEIKRQTKLLESGGNVDMETRLWNDEAGRSEMMRTKEQAQDYRYFPEPDLMDVVVDDAWLESIKAETVELPRPRQKRFMEHYKLSEYDASVLCASRAVADYFESVVSTGVEAKPAANWVMADVLRELNEQKSALEEFPISPERLAGLIGLVQNATVSTNIGREVFAAMLKDDREAEVIIKERGLTQISDTGELDAVLDKVINDNPKPVQDYKNGNKNAVNFLKGQVMRLTKGKANPNLVGELLAKKLS